MLGEKLDAHGATVWLVNTGWTGGPFGVGHRMPIAATRGLLHAALSGELDAIEVRRDPVFGFEVPLAVPGVDSALLDPRSTWADPTPTTPRRVSSPACSGRTSRSASPPTRRSFSPQALKLEPHQPVVTGSRRKAVLPRVSVASTSMT